MNERFHSIARKVMVSSSAILLSVAQFLVPVYAFGSNWTSSGAYKSLGYYQGATYSNQSTGKNGTKYYRALSVTLGANSNTFPNEGVVGVVAYALPTFKNRKSINVGSNANNALYLLFYSFESGWTANGLYSTNNVSWTSSTSTNLSSERTATDSNGTGTKVYYASGYASNWLNRSGYFDADSGQSLIDVFHMVFPNIPIIYGTNSAADIVDVISLDTDIANAPWTMQTSSGGIHFSGGTELDSSNTTVYSNVYTVMDINNDNSITEEEVNYYNVTYETNYDYSSINNSNDFDLYDFLYYVALKIDTGENPAGEGSGGGSQDTQPGTGGIVVGDGSFTQQQTQTIEQNAVNVTVTNNNELTQENLNEINNIINNNTSDQTTFQDAVSNMNQFRGMAIAFAALAGVVLGWLPSWVVGLLGMMFSILSIMIVIRLIHLFV